MMLALPYVEKLTDRIGARPVVLVEIAITTLGGLTYAHVGTNIDDCFWAYSYWLWHGNRDRRRPGLGPSPGTKELGLIAGR